jgi:hypothetical protein
VLFLVRLLTTDPLFPWDKLPDTVGLIALRHLLDLMPDHRMVVRLRAGSSDTPMPTATKATRPITTRRDGMEVLLAKAGSL